jgi:cytochrome c oxidase cbb3-type subunit 3
MADHAHHGPELDKLTGTYTTGHEWDGIKELNTPLPRWWLWTFYACIVWALGYWVVYPAIPLISSHTTGVLGYSSRADVAVEVGKLNAFRTAQAAGLATASFEEIKASPDLTRIALARGKAAFGDNCATCHGVGGNGAPAIANLVDDDWLWGGTPEEIYQTIKHGVRWDQDSNTRAGAMPAFGRTGVLQKAEIAEVVEYTRSLSGLDVAASANMAKGKELFEANCASCHGENGKGMKEVGAPDLTDKIWLYGSSRQAMVEGLNNGRGAQMPAWVARLDDVTIKSLVVYVSSLGGGQ